MAGISFELKRVLTRRTLSAIFKSFSYSTALGAGPYVISITAIFLSYFLALPYVSEKTILIQFQSLITHMIAYSLIISGFSQLVITRFLADRHFEEKMHLLMPNLFGVILINMFFGFVFSFAAGCFIFKDLGFLFIFALSTCFILLCGIWILNIVLTAFKSYKYILFIFVISFASFVLIVFFIAKYGLTALLFAFSIALFLIFSGLLIYYIKSFPSKDFLRKDFLNRKQIYISLIFSGFFYNLGVWADKFVFWFHPDTSIELMGPIRFSPVYDVPIFLAYLAIAPGIGTMFLKIEGEFASKYEKYYTAVREGATLPKIYEYGNQMIDAARGVLFDTFRIQGITFILILLLEEHIFNLFNLSLLYIPLFHVLMVGTFLQLIFITILSLLNYFDRRKEALLATFFFALSNIILSYASIKLGPSFYGYGFVFSLALSNFIGLVSLRRFLNEIHYRTFMLI